MKIEILGTGCHNCLSLEMMAEKIIQGLIEMVQCGLTEIGTYDIIIVEIR